MCRVFGCVASEPVSIRHELLEAENPIIRQAEEHDSGWGLAVYERADGREPVCTRFPRSASVDHDFRAATERRGRMLMAHVRRATMGGLTHENTHPFCLGAYAFCHNGTLTRFPRLLDGGVAEPKGQTDSEVLFNLITRDFDPGDPVESLRRAVGTAARKTPFSGLNFLFSDGERLFAYRLGIFELHWLARPTQLLVASERITDEAWHTVQQDVLLVLDPDDLAEPHAERLLGDEAVARAEIRRVEPPPSLRGAERGRVAAAAAARIGSVADAE